MFDIGWSELLIIGVVALIVVGPKDLPKMFRTVGQMMGKARGMAREFTRAMEAAADETGVKDAARTFRETTSGKSLREAAGFDEIEQEFRAIGQDFAGQPGARTPGAAPGIGAKPAPMAQDASPPPKPVSDFSETEVERLRRAARAAEARLQAAEARARREATVAAPAPVPPTPTPTPPAAAGAPAPPAPPAADS